MNCGPADTDVAFRPTHTADTLWFYVAASSTGLSASGLVWQSHSTAQRADVPLGGSVLDSEHRPLLTERALATNLKAIISEADKTPRHEVAQGAIGVLSTEHRPVWARQRDILKADETNRGNLAVVDRALFVVCLDDTDPETPNELCNSMLCGTSRVEKGVQVGTCTNRYYDKVSNPMFLLSYFLTLQLLAFTASNHCGRKRRGWHQLRALQRRRTHRAAFRRRRLHKVRDFPCAPSCYYKHLHLKHSCNSSLSLILLFARSINNSAGTLFKAKLSPDATGVGKADNTTGSDDEGLWDTTPKKLEWDLVSGSHSVNYSTRQQRAKLKRCVQGPAIRLGVRFAETRLSDLICQNDVISLEYDAFGKNFITREPLHLCRPIRAFSERLIRSSLVERTQGMASVQMPLSKWPSKPPISPSTEEWSPPTNPP